MKNNKILKQFLAIVLIFTLTSTNSLFVTKSLATTIVEEVFAGESDTGHENVGFESYFKTEIDDKDISVISDVNNENLAIDMNLEVEESGYLKNAKIEIAETEEGNGLNFDIKEIDIAENSQIQSIENNIISLKQINSGIETNISLPIEYKNQSYVKESDFSKDFLVKFSGIYVDDEGEEIEVSNEKKLTISWKDNRDIKVETESTKYIDYGGGVILQTLVKVDNTVEGKNTLPIKQTELNIEVPSFLGVNPSDVKVVANTTAGTNGETPGFVTFNENNWNYNENKLTITVNNEKKLVKFNEFEDEFLKDEEKIIEEERYYNQPGVDEYLITYTYKDVTAESIILNSNIEAKVTIFSGVEDEENINIITNKNSYEYSLESQTGSIVSLNIENENKEVSKAYVYSNYMNTEKIETELQSKILLNISNKDIIENLKLEDTENVYIDNSGNAIENSDLYYKEISISKANFNEILGESGEIKIFNQDGVQLALINNEIEVQEDGNILIKFNERISKLKFEVSKPIAEGNLVINAKKAFTDLSLDKATFLNIANIVTKMNLKANYTYVQDEIIVGNIESVTKLLNTTTKANLVIDRNSLSTLSLNENVELRVELNNATDKSDIYGASTFEIILPENIENIDITNVGILYGEGLDILNYTVNGNVITVSLTGVQKGINSAVLTNGTNIVINANLKVNVFTPLKSDKIALRYTNSEATNYEQNGYSETEINYSAPTGLVTVNSILNYRGEGSLITSVKQGKKTDLLDVYTEAKVAKMEILLMNNNENTISNLAILGRFPFKDVKDMITGDNFGTTLDSKLLTGLVQDVNNSTYFKVYYSENKEATKDLNDVANNWTETPESLENIKSYLIVPQDASYQMNKAEVLRFTYDFEVPANLVHNESIYGTYVAYYTNNSETAMLDDLSCPDIVGVTTGAGPELEVKVVSDKQEVNEYEEFKVTASAINVGESKAENVNLEIPIPANASYVSADIENENVTINLEGNSLKVAAENVEVNDKLDVVVNLKADEIQSINSQKMLDSAYIEPKANLQAKDLGATLTAVGEKTKVKEAEFEVSEYNTLVVAGKEDMIFKVGETIDFVVQVKNTTSQKLNNIVVTKEIPAEFKVLSSNVSKYKDGEMVELSKGNYNSETRTLTWNLDSLDSKDCAYMNYSIEIAELSDNLTKTSVGSISKVKADGTETYETNLVLTTIASTVLTVSQVTDTTDSYVKEGESIRYTFTVKNEGDVDLSNVTLVDEMPSGLSISKVTYTYGGSTREDTNPNKNIATVIANLKAKEELIVVIDAKALITDGAKEKTVRNYAKVSADGVESKNSNTVEHIIRSIDEVYASEVSSNENATTTTGGGTTTNVTQTYKVTGTIWEDTNKNGMRDDGEKTISSDVQIRLVESQTGIIKKTITPDVNGRYSLSGVSSGTYLVIFDYDTVKYGITTYRKEGVASNVNSDAIATKLIQDGKTRNGAITDVITVSNESISDIDMGLVLADTFDLELTSSITKVTVQTSKGNSTTNYDNVKLSKDEIAAKYVAGAKVLVEYEIKITNKGDIAGYAKKIVDYLPEGMTFNSSLETNSSWYTGADGNLYSNALSETEIASGESRTLKLVLSKDMTEENTGIVNNLTEIYEDYNIYGVSDYNSTPGNKAQGENDLGSVDTVITIKTGETLIYISVIITTLILGSVAVFMVYRKIVITRKKGGV